MKILLFSVLFCVGNLALAGDFYGSRQPIQIEFKTGAAASMIAGSLRGAEEQAYTFTGTKGQNFVLVVNSDVHGTVEPKLLNPKGTTVKMEFDGKSGWSVVLPASGVYQFFISKIVLGDKPVRYRGFVSLH